MIGGSISICATLFSSVMRCYLLSPPPGPAAGFAPTPAEPLRHEYSQLQ